MLFREPDDFETDQQINGVSSSEPDSDAVRYSREDVDRLLEEQIEQYHQTWQKEKQKIYKEAYDEGFEAGKEQVLQTIEGSMDNIRRAIKQSEQSFKQMLDNLKPYMMALVFDLAEKILSLPIKSTKLEKRVEEEIRKMIAYLDEEAQVKVTIPEVDFELLREALSTLKESDRMKLYSSSELKSGEYCLETKEEKIIKDLKKILREFRETITFGDIELIDLDE